MLVIQEYNNANTVGPAYKIYSNNNFFIRKGSFVYQEVIVKNPSEINEYVETQTPVPAPIASIEYIHSVFFGNFQNITKEQINQAKPILLKALKTLSDEEAYLIKFFFDEWENNKKYEVGDRVLFNGELYNVIKTPIDNSLPSNNSEYYVLTNKPLDLIEEWDSVNRKAYNVGDKVKVGEHYYESLIEGNTWSPQDFPTAWKLIQ